MQEHRDFIREYRKSKFPYKEIISQNKVLRYALFGEFVKTKKKTCFDLLLSEHYTERELNDGFENVHKHCPSIVSVNTNNTIAASIVLRTQFEIHVRSLYMEFNKNILENTLNAKYYCFDLQATNTVKTLTEIGETIELFKNVLIRRNVVDYDNEAKRTSKSVLSLIERLAFQDLKYDVLNAIINDKEYVPIDIKQWSGNSQNNLRDNYTDLKMFFDVYLNEGYGLFRSATNTRIVEQRIPKTFDELFSNPESIKPCTNVLKELDDKAVSDDLKTFIGMAGIAVVWVQELKNKSFIKPVPNKDYAALLQTKFKDFSINASMFGKGKIPKGAEKYRTGIKALLGKIKP